MNTPVGTWPCVLAWLGLKASITCFEEIGVLVDVELGKDSVFGIICDEEACFLMKQCSKFKNPDPIRGVGGIFRLIKGYALLSCSTVGDNPKA